MPAQFFRSQFLRDNFEEIRSTLDGTSFEEDTYFDVLRAPLLSGIAAGDDLMARRAFPSDFNDIAEGLGYTDTNMAVYEAFKFGLAIGYFESLDRAVDWFVSDYEDYERIVTHLKEYLGDDEATIENVRAASKPWSALALLDSYVVENNRPGLQSWAV